LRSLDFVLIAVLALWVFGGLEWAFFSVGGLLQDFFIDSRDWDWS
jgi:hypothetical protein